MSDSLIFRDDIERAGWFAICAARGGGISRDAAQQAADGVVRASRKRTHEPRDPRACVDCGELDCQVAHISDEDIEKLFPSKPEPCDHRTKWSHVDGVITCTRCDMVMNPTPNPQVPDSPGWWWWQGHSAEVAYNGGRPWMPIRVRLGTVEEGLRWSAGDFHNKPVKGWAWGGRCTRDSPDDGLRARVKTVYAEMYAECTEKTVAWCKLLREALHADQVSDD